MKISTNYSDILKRDELILLIDRPMIVSSTNVGKREVSSRNMREQAM